MSFKFWSGVSGLIATSLLLFSLSACGSSNTPTLFIGGIPDQDIADLQIRFNGLADYLEAELDIPVVYVPSTSYVALVTAFESGGVQLGWFGGLTGVQARLEVPGANAIAQRARDQEFRSAFIVHKNVAASNLPDLVGLTFTFGSESSTSGHLMPRYFLDEIEIDPEADFREGPAYSGSHAKTLRLVQEGAYQAGVLSIDLWERAVIEGTTGDAQLLATTQPYYDYHWLLHPEVDERFGIGTSQKIINALLTAHTDPSMTQILELFQGAKFIPTQNSNYSQIEQVARDLDLLGEY